MTSIVIALGGNAILPAQGTGTIAEQLAVTEQVMGPIADLVEANHRVLITHGNGPIVGNIMIRNEAARDRIAPMPLYICGADSQGGIGLMLQQALSNELHRRHLQRAVATVVTQVAVDPDDPAFADPTKPIGPYYTAEEGTRIATERKWVVREDANRGYRRMVPSPEPRRIVELEPIRTLLDGGTIVIAVGGGGVPVRPDADGLLHGVDAVIDKDHASCRIALDLGFETLAFVTGVEAVQVDFGTPAARPLGRVGVSEVATLVADGQFPPGSMGPKIDAALDFLAGGGGEVLITDPVHFQAALDGRAGTHVVPDAAGD